MNRYEEINTDYINFVKLAYETYNWLHVDSYEVAELEEIRNGTHDHNKLLNNGRWSFHFKCCSVTLRRETKDYVYNDDGSVHKIFTLFTTLNLSSLNSSDPDVVDETLNEYMSAVALMKLFVRKEYTIEVLTAAEAAEKNARDAERLANQKVNTIVREAMELLRKGMRVGGANRPVPGVILEGVAPGRYEQNFNDYKNQPLRTYVLNVSAGKNKLHTLTRIA